MHPKLACGLFENSTSVTRTRIFTTFRCGALTCLSLDNFRSGSAPWELSYGRFLLGAVAWGVWLSVWLRNFRLACFARELSLGISRLGALA